MARERLIEGGEYSYVQVLPDEPTSYQIQIHYFEKKSVGKKHE